MSEVLARFQDLKGIGPATEARLHEAGIRTWEALATAASALAAVGGSAKEVAGLVAARRAEAEAAETEAAQAERRAAPGPAAPAPRAQHALPGGEPATVVEPEPAGLPAAVSPSRDHLVVLDAGKAIGGAAKEIALTVDGLGAVAGAGYRAELCTRRLGDHPVADWSVAARRSGPVPVDDGGVLPLDFGPVPLPAGIHRLQVRLHLGLLQPAAHPPTLTVA